MNRQQRLEMEAISIGINSAVTDIAEALEIPLSYGGTPTEPKEELIDRLLQRLERR